jgi:hypothetical protein
MGRARDLILFASGIIAALFLLSLNTVSATSANISHSYIAADSIQDGSLVSLDSSKTGYVELANTDNGQQLIGVAVANDNSLLAVDPSSNKVQVATSGTTDILVSNVNGPIKVGDQISVSPFDGVGMKATAGSHVIGVAQTSFNSSTNGATVEHVVDKAGKTASIMAGYIQLGIDIGTGSAENGNQLNGLQEFSQNLTGHAVSTARVIVSMIVAIVAFLALITLIYASIYGGIIAIGRNPLAKYAIFHGLAYVMAMVAVITIVASATVFLLLR